MAHNFTATTTAATITRAQFLDKRFTQIWIQNRGASGLFIGIDEIATTDKLYIPAGETVVYPNVDTNTISVLAETGTVALVTQTF